MKQQKLKNNALYIAFLFIGLLVCNYLPAQALGVMAEDGEKDQSNACLFVIQNEGDTFKFSKFSTRQKDSFSWQSTAEFKGIRVFRTNDSFRLIAIGSPPKKGAQNKDNKVGLIFLAFVFALIVFFAFFSLTPKNNGYKY